MATLKWQQISINNYLKYKCTKIQSRVQIGLNQEDTTIMLPTRDSLGWRTHRFEIERMEKIFHGNRNDKKAGVAIPISEKTDFKTKSIKTKDTTK